MNQIRRVFCKNIQRAWQLSGVRRRRCPIVFHEGREQESCLYSRSCWSPMSFKTRVPIEMETGAEGSTSGAPAIRPEAGSVGVEAGSLVSAAVEGSEAPGRPLSESVSASGSVTTGAGVVSGVFGRMQRRFGLLGVLEWVRGVVLVVVRERTCCPGGAIVPVRNQGG